MTVYTADVFFVVSDRKLPNIRFSELAVSNSMLPG